MAASASTEVTAAGEKRLKAMMHPLRRLILRVIRDRKVPTAPVEVANELGVDLQKVAYHCRELVRYGCIEKVRSEPVRGAIKNYYVATAQHVIETDEWEKVAPSLREGQLADFFQPLVDDFTAAVKDGILGKDADWHITRTPVHAIDQKGLEELLAAHRQLWERIDTIQAASLERMSATDEEPIKVSSSQACFKVRTF
jgi:DNA-binding MarR family transcriptional regulator